MSEIKLISIPPFLRLSLSFSLSLSSYLHIHSPTHAQSHSTWSTPHFGADTILQFQPLIHPTDPLDNTDSSSTDENKRARRAKTIKESDIHSSNETLSAFRSKLRDMLDRLSVQSRNCLLVTTHMAWMTRALLAEKMREYIPSIDGSALCEKNEKKREKRNRKRGKAKRKKERGMKRRRKAEEIRRGKEEQKDETGDGNGGRRRIGRRKNSGRNETDRDRGKESAEDSAESQSESGSESGSESEGEPHERDGIGYSFLCPVRNPTLYSHDYHSDDEKGDSEKYSLLSSHYHGTSGKEEERRIPQMSSNNTAGLQDNIALMYGQRGALWVRCFLMILFSLSLSLSFFLFLFSLSLSLSFFLILLSLTHTLSLLYFLVPPSLSLSLSLSIPPKEKRKTTIADPERRLFTLRGLPLVPIIIRSCFLLDLSYHTLRHLCLLRSAI